jgi:DNA-binding SARP family transcriptional activator
MLIPTLALSFLGTREVRLVHQLMDWPSGKATARPAYLAVTTKAQVRDSLAAMLWSDADQVQAQGAP